MRLISLRLNLLRFGLEFDVAFLIEQCPDVDASFFKDFLVISDTLNEIMKIAEISAC